MTSFSRDAWNQLKNKTIQDIQRALERDGWKKETRTGATIGYRHPTRPSPHNRVVLHMHPKATKGPKLLKGLLGTIGWTGPVGHHWMEDDLHRLKLIRLPGKKARKRG